MSKDQVDDHPELAFVRSGDQREKISVGTKDWVDGAVIGNVVAEVAHWRFEER
jgi:hypothetical protein